MAGSRNHGCYSDEERRRNRGPCAYDARGTSERAVLSPLVMISRTVRVWSPPARSEGSCCPRTLLSHLWLKVHEAVMPRSLGSRPAKPHAQCPAADTHQARHPTLESLHAAAGDRGRPHDAVSEKPSFLPSNGFKASQNGSPFCPWSLETVTPGSDPRRAGGIRARLRQSRLLKNVPLAMVLKFVFLS